MAVGNVCRCLAFVCRWLPLAPLRYGLGEIRFVDDVVAVEHRAVFQPQSLGRVIVVPLVRDEAPSDSSLEWHCHHKPVVGYRFSLGAEPLRP